jgi:hypothetical protein
MLRAGAEPAAAFPSPIAPPSMLALPIYGELTENSSGTCDVPAAFHRAS